MLSGGLTSSEDFLGHMSGGQGLGAQLTMSAEALPHALPLCGMDFLTAWWLDSATSFPADQGSCKCLMI